MPHIFELNKFKFTLVFSKEEGANLNDEAPFILMPFSCFNELDLADEIDGETSSLAELVLLSAKTSSTVFCGIKTAIAGLKHISIAICHRGRLVDIVDRTANPASDYYSSGDKIKIFSTDFGRIAVLVDTDILLEKNWARVATECDIILGIMKDINQQFLDIVAYLSKIFNKSVVCVCDEQVLWVEN